MFGSLQLAWCVCARFTLLDTVLIVNLCEQSVFLCVTSMISLVLSISNFSLVYLWLRLVTRGCAVRGARLVATIVFEFARHDMRSFDDTLGWPAYVKGSEWLRNPRRLGAPTRGQRWSKGRSQVALSWPGGPSGTGLRPWVGRARIPGGPESGMYYNGGRHSPFQVLDASAIEGIRGLAGESSSIYSCIQIYKALTPPAPPAYRGATEGPGPPSYVGSSEERPCPDLGLCAPPSAPAGAGAAAGGWAPPPPDDCTCRVKPRLKSPPPWGGKRAAAPLRCEGRP